MLKEANTQDACSKLQTQILELIDDMKAVDVTVLNVSHLTDVCDVMIIASGTSSRHVKSINDHLVTELKQSEGIRPLNVEGEKDANWILTDYGDIIIHIMHPETREFYQLEKLWSVNLTK